MKFIEWVFSSPVICFLKGHQWQWVSWSFEVEYICMRCGGYKGGLR